MIKSIALFSIFGLPLAAYGGILTIILLLVAAAVGSLTLKGSIKAPVSLHVWLARTAIILAIIHGVFALSIFF